VRALRPAASRIIATWSPSNKRTLARADDPRRSELPASVAGYPEADHERPLMVAKSDPSTSGRVLPVGAGDPRFPPVSVAATFCADKGQCSTTLCPHRFKSGREHVGDTFPTQWP